MKCPECSAAMFWRSTRLQWFCLKCKATVDSGEPVAPIKKPQKPKKPRVKKQVTRLSEDLFCVLPSPKQGKRYISKTVWCPNEHTAFWQERHQRFYCLQCRAGIELVNTDSEDNDKNETMITEILL